MLIFEERGKPENPEKNLLQQSKEPTTNSWPEHGPRRLEARAITATPSMFPNANYAWHPNRCQENLPQAYDSIMNFHATNVIDF